MGAELLAWRGREPIVVDATRVALLRGSVGERRAREIVEEAAFQLGDRLATLAAARAAGDLAVAAAAAARAAAIGEQVGLVSLAGIARGLAACLVSGDAVAQAAATARLERVAEDSLCALLEQSVRSAP